MFSHLKNAFFKYSLSEPGAKSKEEQEAFLNALPIPRDAIERAYLKYLCRGFLCTKRIETLLLNAASMLLFVPLWGYYSVRAVVCRNRSGQAEHWDALIRYDAAFPQIDDLIPARLRERYPLVRFLEMKKYHLAWMDADAQRLLIECMLRHPIRFYMNLVMMINLADCCRTLDLYKPKALISYAEERNFSKPVVAELCLSRGVAYEAFMHGECYYQIDKGLLYYSRYYVWGNAYIRMFDRLRCRCEYETYIPSRFYHALRPVARFSDTEYFLTYYLGSEDKDTLVRICGILSFIERNGLRCKIRMHPRFSNREVVADVFRGFHVESCTMDESLEKTFCAAALYSTVQEEAYYSGRVIVFDDLSDPKSFADLIHKGAVLIERPHWLLSELHKYANEGALQQFLAQAAAPMMGDDC